MTLRPIALDRLYRFEVHDRRAFPLHPGARLDLVTAAFLPRGALARRDGFRGTAFLASLARAPHYRNDPTVGDGADAPRHGPWSCADLRPADYEPLAPAELPEHLQHLLGPRGGLGPVDATVREALESLWAHLALGATHAWRLGSPPHPVVGASGRAPVPAQARPSFWAELLLANVGQRWLTQATFSGRDRSLPGPDS